MKTEEIFFIVRIEVQTQHTDVAGTLQEMEKISRFFITNTPKVSVIHSEILTTQTRNLRNSDHGA